MRNDPRAAWIPQLEPPDPGAYRSDITTPVALVYHPEYGHTDLHNHPESKERVLAILDHLQTAEPFADAEPLTFVSPHSFVEWNDDLPVTLEVHDEGWIRRVKEVSLRLTMGQRSDVVLEGDTEVPAGSTRVRCWPCAAHFARSMSF
jgi:acetoin utilization deacetylase AcuC-like enzyme